MKAQASAMHDNTLRLRRLGIDTYQESVVYMRSDCHFCRSEGFEAQTRIEIQLRDRWIMATLNVLTHALLDEGEASLSESAWRLLDAMDGDKIELRRTPPLGSMSHVRAKVYGKNLDEAAMLAIVRDIAAGRYSDLHLAAFVTACAGNRLDLDETIALTKAMVAVGDRLQWPGGAVMDKHCVGGLPGNRTTLIVVPIVVACGLTMPKTSSRAITSPAGTADTMETLAPVSLDIAAIQAVVEKTGGCIVWGGSVRLSPADDVLIRVERPLDLDSEGQLVASVLSKKLAAGSTHVVIDIPVGSTAKVRSAAAASALALRLNAVGQSLGIEVRIVLTDGSQPVGRGIGPALEAWDVLSVLKREKGFPKDLEERALRLAAEILEMSSKVPVGQGNAVARAVLESGRAWRKFEEICEAQGGMRIPPRAKFTHPVTARRSGRVIEIDNRRLARAAKLTGAPMAPMAGVMLHAPLGSHVEKGQALYTLHAEAPGELSYVLDYVAEQSDIIQIGDLE